MGLVGRDQRKLCRPDRIVDPTAELRLRNIQIVGIQVEPDTWNTEPLGGHRSATKTYERIEHKFSFDHAVQLDAHLWELHWERRGMRALAVAIANGSIGNEPRIPATPEIRLCSLPAADIAFVCVWHSDRQSVKLRGSGLREVKDHLLAVVQVSRA